MQSRYTAVSSNDTSSATLEYIRIQFSWKSFHPKMAGTEMTASLLRKYCKDNGLYSTPSINDKLYLHYKGFRCIQNLEEYTGLRCIWLEGNGLSRIEGLEKQTNLRTLFLQENIIEKIENLEAQVDLDALNLSKNYITKIENLSHMQKLTSLNLSHNLLSSASDIKELAGLESIQTIDLQHNKITDVDILDIFGTLKDLRVLYLMGNPVVKSIKHYRKTIISRCKLLKYLDDRPVFDDERRRVEAWMAAFEISGDAETANEAERNELLKIRKEKDDADERNFRAFEELMKQGALIRQQQQQQQTAAPDEGVTAVPTNTNIFSGETIIDVPESDCLREAREMRWAATSVDNTAEPAFDDFSSAQSLPTVEEDLTCLDRSSVSTPVPEVEEWTKLQIDSTNDINEDAEENQETTIEDTAVGTTRIRFSSLLSQSAAEVAKDIKPLQLEKAKQLDAPVNEEDVRDNALSEATDLAELD